MYQQRKAASIAAVPSIWTESDAEAYVAYVTAKLNEWQERMPPTVRGLRDIRLQLATRLKSAGPAGPYATLPLDRKQGLVVHYSGPPVGNREDTLSVLKAEAQYHVGKNWARAGESPIYGDGLMYHVAVGDDGTKYQCRDLEAVLWHCGVTAWNKAALSVHVPIGGVQRASAAQLQALTEVVDDWRALTGTPRSDVRGHQELSPTSCPGTLMADFVYPYRGGTSMANGQWFSETGFYIGGAFWEFWLERGGLPLFGNPLTNELREDGRIVQYFERAVFEWHPENAAPFQVLLRLLGAQALARRVA